MIYLIDPNVQSNRPPCAAKCATLCTIVCSTYCDKNGGPIPLYGIDI
jgi:hypothetical protein